MALSTQLTYRAPAEGFLSFREFWPYYVAMHSRARTRQLHLTGTLSGLTIAVAGLLRGHPRAVLAWPALGYGFAWPSHWLVEGNNPASFGHPLWSLRGDFAMAVLMLSGRDHELQSIARTWLDEHCPAGEEKKAIEPSYQRLPPETSRTAGRTSVR